MPVTLDMPRNRPSPHVPLGRSRRLGIMRLLAGALVLGAAFGAVAQEAEHESAPPRIDPADINGRTFAGLDIGGSSLMGGASFGASRAAEWTEQDLDGAPVQRLYLERDVQVRIGAYRFTSARAVVWIRTLREDPAGATHEFAVYFDRVSNPSAEAGFGQDADRLLVTGAAGGEVSLKTDLLARGRVSDPLVGEGERRLAKYLRAIVAPEEAGAEPGAPEFRDVPWPTVEPGSDRPVKAAGTGPGGPIVPGEARPYAIDSPFRSPELTPVEPLSLPATGLPQTAPIFPANGIVVFACQGTVVLRDAGQPGGRAALFTGGVIAQFIDATGGRSPVQIAAQRAVVFLDPEADATDLTAFSMGQVRGVYLEGDVVAGNDRYTLRGPRVYYDVAHDRALMLDAVFWTYDQRRELPLYLRAAAISQEADNQFRATNASISTTSFLDPHLRLGASSLTITRVDQPDSPTGSSTIVDARDATARIGAPPGLPFFWYPRFRGDIENFPLRDIRIESESGSGAALKTTWDIFGLANKRPPEGFDADLLVDGYFDRGLALGTELSWNRGPAAGNLLAYSLLNDTGTDRMTSGARIDRDGETRGILLAEHRWALNEAWTVFLEGAYLSDEAFADAFFEQLAETRREFSTGGFARRLKDNTSLALLAKGSFNDFIANEYLLQSQGYSVSKLPEATYARIADDLLSGMAPGLLTYSSDYGVSRMSMNFNEPTSAEMGFDTPARSQEAFGLTPDQSLADRLSAAGFTESTVDRVDTRQELTMTLSAGPVKITPFLTGRATAYDDEFEAFSPTEDDEARFWGASGVRASTSLQHVDDSVDSRFFDLHRIRHVIEPYVTGWTASTNVDQTDLPVYDDEVESLADGSAVKIGLDQTWQTMRGGEGRWRSVDVFRFNASLVESSDEADFESPIGRFFDYRPEYSLLGDYATLEAGWQATNAMSLGAAMVYDFDVNQPARSSLGAVIQHTDYFSTFGEVRFINARDSTLASAGIGYDLTRKYRARVWGTYDTDIGDVQSVDLDVSRRFPEATLRFGLSYDNIANKTSVGVVFEPAGVFNSSRRFTVTSDSNR